MRRIIQVMVVSLVAFLLLFPACTSAPAPAEVSPPVPAPYVDWQDYWHDKGPGLVYDRLALLATTPDARSYVTTFWDGIQDWYILSATENEAYISACSYPSGKYVCDHWEWAGWIVYRDGRAIPQAEGQDFWNAVHVEADIEHLNRGRGLDLPLGRIDQEGSALIALIEVDPCNSEGVKFVAPKSGRYEITVVGGAYSYGVWALTRGWRTWLILYVNKPIEWGESEWGLRPINSSMHVGEGNSYRTFLEAEAAGKGSSVEVYLNKDGYVITLVDDVSEYYFKNNGSVKIRVVGPQG